MDNLNLFHQINAVQKAFDYLASAEHYARNAAQEHNLKMAAGEIEDAFKPQRMTREDSSFVKAAYYSAQEAKHKLLKFCFGDFDLDEIIGGSMECLEYALEKLLEEKEELELQVLDRHPGESK